MHMLLGALLWVVFAYYWYLVMNQPVAHQTQTALIIVGSIVGGITLADILWIAHNVRIAKHSRRRARREAAAPPATDFLGRTFTASSEDELHRAHYIEVHVVQMEDDEHAEGRKLFRVTDHVPEAD